MICAGCVGSGPVGSEPRVVRGSWSWKLRRRQPSLCVCGDHAWVPITRGYVALVSAADIALLSKRNWTANPRDGKVYVRRGIVVDGKRTSSMLHREVMDASEGQLVDHRDGKNPLDNRRGNLRIASAQQNTFNTPARRGTSKYKGVSWVSRDKVWRAYIRDGVVPGARNVCLGSFGDETEAAQAYDAAARERHGEFAYLNFPEQP